jgi:hypothetical protein
MDSACGTTEERRTAYRVLVEKSDGRRRGHNTKMNIREVGWGDGLNLFGSGQRQVTSSCKCGNETAGSIKCREFLD